MALISLLDVSIGFGGPRLLDEINLQIERREWVGLLGRNGAGKSTLLKLISGEVEPHSGTIARQQNLQVAHLPQEVPQDLNGTVLSIVESGLEATTVALDDEHQWQRQHQVEKILSQMELDPQARVEPHSAGMRRRVYLARGLNDFSDFVSCLPVLVILANNLIPIKIFTVASLTIWRSIYRSLGCRGFLM